MNYRILGNNRLQKRCKPWALLFLLVLQVTFSSRQTSAASFAEVIDRVQPKIVKIYGAGGFRGLEAYQSGFLVSQDGLVLTAWSYVLDTDLIRVVLSDGQKFVAELVGMDPRLQIALLKIDARELEYFSLASAARVGPGSRILAFSNLFGIATGDEQASVLHGNIVAKTSLTTRRASSSSYQGSVYVLDAMTNNPGAAGGALCDRQGRLVGLLGKELKNSLNSTWLNYAIPREDLAESVKEIQSGKILTQEFTQDEKKAADPLTLGALGIVLVPNALSRTPPYIDLVRRKSAAEKVGLKADDLILFLNNQIVRSINSLRKQLDLIEQDEEIELVVKRGQQLFEVTLFTTD